MAQLEKYGLYVLCLVLVIVLGGNLFYNQEKLNDKQAVLAAAPPTNLTELLAPSPADLKTLSIWQVGRLVDYYDLTEKGAGSDPTEDEKALIGKLNEEYALLVQRFPRFEEWGTGQRSAILFWAYDLRQIKGGQISGLEYAELLSTLLDERWRSVPGDDRARHEAQQRKWSAVVRSFAATKYAQESVFKSQRIIELLTGYEFHNSVTLGRSEYLAMYVAANDWFAKLSPARQRAMMELSLWQGKDPATVANFCFPKCYAALRSAVMMEAEASAVKESDQVVLLGLSQKYYEEAALEIVPRGGRLCLVNPILARAISSAIRNNELLD